MAWSSEKSKTLLWQMRTLLLHAKIHWPEMITAMLWQMALKAACHGLSLGRSYLKCLFHKKGCEWIGCKSSYESDSSQCSHVEVGSGQLCMILAHSSDYYWYHFCQDVDPNAMLLALKRSFNESDANAIWAEIKIGQYNMDVMYNLTYDCCTFFLNILYDDGLDFGSRHP